MDYLKEAKEIKEKALMELPDLYHEISEYYNLFLSEIDEGESVESEFEHFKYSIDELYLLNK